MKLILPLDLVTDIEPHLPSNTQIVRVDEVLPIELHNPKSKTKNGIRE
ncbi:MULTISPECIES: hypothetical protein [unclassified Nostoc]|nr:MULTISPECIES: hypothetical protein [unclassified Nostoc]MDM9586127.1 hypothetical protein [Nostoc sp. GT001]MDZ7945573.1 hypothetical protein [Nostoc sp. EfeVER01]